MILLSTLLIISATQADNTLSDYEARTGWKLLFDGRTTKGWKRFGADEPVGSGWKVEEGALTYVPGTGSGGDVMTDQDYADFDLLIDWKVAPGGNSGLFFRSDPTQNPSYLTGPEMQILDNARHPDRRNVLTSAGAIYGVFPANLHAIRPAGEWNTFRITAIGPWVRHFANGVLVANYRINSESWKKKKDASMFKDWDQWGQKPTGRIVMQDHGDRVAFKNIKIRVIQSKP